MKVRFVKPLMVVVCSIALACDAGVFVHSASAADGDKKLEIFKKEIKPTDPLIPAGVKMETKFVPGKGDPVGKVQKLEGDVYVMHKGESVAYRLANDSPLFNGDTIVTMTGSLVNALLNDKSVLALAANAKLSLNDIQFDSAKQERDSTVNLLWGKARFIVNKLAGSKARFGVSTPTSVCAVRGSDFAVAVGPEPQLTSWWQRLFDKFGFVSEAHAQIVALGSVFLAAQNTTLVVTGMVGPATTVTSLTVAVAGTGVSVTVPVSVSLSALTAAMNAVAPGLAALSMPPGFN